MEKNKASDKKPATERQQIITWHTPEERLPKKFIDVLVTFSAQLEDSNYQHALGIATYWPDKTWLIDGLNPEESDTATIHAWADIEPYCEKKEMKTMNMDYRAFKNIVREIVADYTNRAEDDDLVSPNEVYIVWMCKTLQNWKALAATPLEDGRYFEITFNGDKNELYLDAYRKEANEVTKF